MSLSRRDAAVSGSYHLFSLIASKPVVVMLRGVSEWLNEETTFLLTATGCAATMMMRRWKRMSVIHLSLNSLPMSNISFGSTFYFSILNLTGSMILG